jgi:predicted flavoprotein YhiN
MYIDLAPDRSADRLTNEVTRSRGSSSWARHLERTVGLRGVKIGLLREVLTPPEFEDSEKLVASIKALPIRLVAVRPVAEAISSAGGVMFTSLDARLMLKALPSVFCAGEMLDWEAPTGGYLLTACFATGQAAGRGGLDWLEDRGI